MFGGVAEVLGGIPRPLQCSEERRPRKGAAAEPLNPRPYNIIYFPTGWAFSAQKKVFERVRDQM